MLEDPQKGSVVNPFTFAGQPVDITNGLTLFPLRAYDPTLGRFLSNDPLPAANGYAYASNDPLNVADSSGGQEETEYNTTVYIAREAKGCYVGVSKNFFARQAAHGARFANGLTPLVGGLSRFSALSLESYIIAAFGGPGGLLTNEICSIGLSDEAVAAAESVLKSNGWIADFLLTGCT